MGLRECFVAPPGYAIVSVDYDAFEMRTWAQICYWIFKHSDLRDILNDPKRCPHVEMGARIMEMPIADGYALKGTDPKAFKKMRSLAKGPNFGLPGGMREARLIDYCRLGYGVELTLEQATKARNTWLAMYREADPYLSWVEEQVNGPGSREIVYFHEGKQRRKRVNDLQMFGSGMIRGSVGYTDGCNGYFQHLAAYIAKRAGTRLRREAYSDRASPLYGCRPAAFIHDEWLYFVPLDRVHEAGFRMAEIMTSTASEIAPDVLFTASPAAFFRWSKAAGDPCLDANGRLVVYEDFKGLPRPANQSQQPHYWS